MWIPSEQLQAEAAKKKLQEQLAEDHRNDTGFGCGKWMELLVVLQGFHTWGYHKMDGLQWKIHDHRIKCD